ncbi:polysaccharide lyase family 7 protein [Qipengyuania sp. S6317L1]|uniref:polysaccharide lyase family 7 protein n=1 Tax=Qipengyuania sp. S6317L1 TaxID=2926410 RepID=UPI001FF5E6A7|nr:polysaccharide lyase family 7 protein [Qipengyuania sp. S6317L1]
MRASRKLCISGLTLAGSLVALAAPLSVMAATEEADVPGSAFDLSQWKITLPSDDDGNQKPDEISVSELQGFAHPDFFYLDDEGRMVFAAPNKAPTTANSTNTRSELRQMLRGTNSRIGTHDPGNNFAVEARKGSDTFASIGGKLEATLRVDHVSTNAGDPTKRPAYSAVVGQIHAVKYKSTRSGFGYGNEPIKIYYKKFPEHETGSVFWTYERNLAKDDPDRSDLAVPVFGYAWDNGEDPGADGIALGEDFSYTINVHRNTMYLTFHNERLGTVRHTRSLVRGADDKDNPYAYGGDSLYFKAGIYNQCSTRTGTSMWYSGCPGTGDWETDKAKGNYAQASFSRLVVGPSTPPE